MMVNNGSKPLLVDDVDDFWGDFELLNILGITNYNNPRTGNPELNQPGFNGMIEGF